MMAIGVILLYEAYKHPNPHPVKRAIAAAKGG
jgi:hypothetical protein